MTKQKIQVVDDGGITTYDFDSSVDGYPADFAYEMISNGNWGDGDCSIPYKWRLYNEDDEEVDFGTGVYYQESPEPPCTEDEHDWQGIGGCDRNPGVWSLGGTKMFFRSCCSYCGMIKETTDPGRQNNSGECVKHVYIASKDR
jgi:hypothetical protein